MLATKSELKTSRGNTMKQLAYGNLSTDEISLEIKSVQRDNDSVSMAIIICPQTHVLLAWKQQKNS